MSTIIGLVLCGGNSSRMGKDKGLLKKNWKTWSQRAEDLLLQLEIPVYISINREQLPEYKQFHAVESLMIDEVEVKGPLAGILTAHKRFSYADVLVLASDMIFMRPSIPEHLVSMSCLNRRW